MENTNVNIDSIKEIILDSAVNNIEPICTSNKLLLSWCNSRNFSYRLVDKYIGDYPNLKEDNPNFVLKVIRILYPNVNTYKYLSYDECFGILELGYEKNYSQENILELMKTYEDLYNSITNVNYISIAYNKSNPKDIKTFMDIINSNNQEYNYDYYESIYLAYISRTIMKDNNIINYGLLNMIERCCKGDYNYMVNYNSLINNYSIIFKNNKYYYVKDASKFITYQTENSADNIVSYFIREKDGLQINIKSIEDKIIDHLNRLSDDIPYVIEKDLFLTYLYIFSSDKIFNIYLTSLNNIDNSHNHYNDMILLNSYTFMYLPNDIFHKRIGQIYEFMKDEGMLVDMGNNDYNVFDFIRGIIQCLCNRKIKLYTEDIMITSNIMFYTKLFSICYVFNLPTSTLDNYK
ncbi:Hypothetical protein ORPV_538 [Orpheovirus IHUMI-LCC2]|uniref:Uncharacterized protein n=1 Tax=Orpheovirus IHUMI-LCC2 TaxID=2023057 RepID=A0A2I2L4G7_9VIRU|nr:Hypothetical protein ORPV_538 [Orpheovirus IHUMI-LCC2]SNW62442.1 Hypothetical protein ORPV_538 [Orpheovirus IHUMI-LCC2]